MAVYVGSPFQAMRKGRSGGTPPDVLKKVGVRHPVIEPIHHKTVTRKPLGLDSLAEGSKATAIAKQQCLAVNLVSLLHSVLVAQLPEATSNVDGLPGPDEIFKGTDENILNMLEKQYSRFYDIWQGDERHRRLPGLSALFSVAQERPLLSKRGLRCVFYQIKGENSAYTDFSLGSNGAGLQELFSVCNNHTHPCLSKLQQCNESIVNALDATPVSLEQAREAFLAGEATEAEKRVLREHMNQEEEAQSKENEKEGLKKTKSHRRKSSGHFFTWGDCTVPKPDPNIDDAADDVFMQDLAGIEDEKTGGKKKTYGGRKRRLSVNINDEIEPTKIVDDQGVFHFGDFAIDTTGGSYDYSGYGASSSGGAAALDFAFGDFAIGVDEETVRKHEPQRLQPGKKKLALDVPKKEPKAQGLAIVNYTIKYLIGHAARVKCVAISPDERHILSCSHEDVLVVLSDINSGKEMVSFSGHDDTLTSVAFSSDQKHVATTSRDQNLILWDAITAKVLLQFEHDKVVICCAWSKSGRLIVSGCQDKVCRVWDTKKGKERSAFTEHTAIIISLDFAPDDKNIVSASADKYVPYQHFTYLCCHSNLFLRWSC